MPLTVCSCKLGRIKQLSVLHYRPLQAFTTKVLYQRSRNPCTVDGVCTEFINRLGFCALALKTLILVIHLKSQNVKCAYTSRMLIYIIPRLLFRIWSGSRVVVFFSIHARIANVTERRRRNFVPLKRRVIINNNFWAFESKNRVNHNPLYNNILYTDQIR